MTTLKNLFLEQFEDRWRGPLIAFGTRISESNADVLIFMARKAACLFHCLEDLRLAHTNAICTSDLALESDLSWLSGKHVLLVDDTLITGTTLYSARQRLADVGAASVSTTVFCVDRENWCRELVEPVEPYILAEPHDVTSFSAQAVRAISIIPRPYLVDFPLYGFVRLRGLSLDPVLSMTGWGIDELTTHSQRKAGATSVTMTPPSRALNALDQHLGWQCSNFAQLIKIRLYTRIRGGRGKTPVHFCRVLPIVAFDPTTRTQLDARWLVFERNVGDRAKILGARLRSAKERLRLLQYFCAARLFDIWLADIRDMCAPRRVTFELDFRQVDFGFSPAVRDDVIDILRDTTRYPFGGAPCFTQTQLPTRPGLTVTTLFKGVDLPGVQAKLTEPFAALYTQRELPARQLVKEYGVRAFELPEYRDLIDRLNQGISLPELRESLSCLGDMRSARLFVSMFMDDAVDRGIAVPITVDDGTYVYRAFRHGEDVKFTEIEARLVCLMLQEVGRALSISSLPRLVVEKLIVLLIRGGLSRGFIERWTGSLGDRKAAGIRFYLQGAVAQLSPDRRPYHYSPGDSLTSLLKGWGYLTESTKGGQYQLGQFPDRPPTTTAMEKDAKALGATIGLALSGTSAEQRDDELTLIATCLSPMDTIAALAAELHYFESHWEPLARALFGNTIPPNADEVVRGHGVYKAVNSGLWKWRNYGDGAPAKMLRAWHDRLAKLPTAVFADAVLEGAFPVSDSSFCSSEINGLIDLAGRWLLKVNIALRRLRIELISASPNAALGTTRRSIADLQAQIQRIEHEAGFVEAIPAPTQGTQLDLPLPIAPVERQGELTGVLGELGILIIEARAILDQVDALVTPFGQPRPLHYYRHLLTIHLGDCDGRSQIVDDRIATAVRKLTIEASKSSSSADLYPLTNANDLWAADFAVAATGLFGREWLSRIAYEVFSVVSRHAKCRICLWADLEPDEQIVRGENTSEALARNLQCRVHSLVATLALRPSRDELIVLSSHGLETVAAVRNEVNKHMGDTIHSSTSSQDISLTEPRHRTYTMETLEKLSPGQKSKLHADIGIITVVPEEMNAAIEMLKQSEKYTKVRKDGAVYYMANMPADEGGQHFVVATQQLEQGNRSVILAYDRLCREYQPSAVILLGIGGSIDPDIKLCDVVIADQVIWYEQATVTDTGVNRKGESSKLSAWLRTLLNDFFAQKGYPFQLSYTDDDELRPRAHLGPIGTGEKVVRFRDDEIRKWLIGFNYKCMALETEAGGLAQAFYETSTTTSYLAKGYMVIRGISDHANKDKNDKWRKNAAHNACTFLRDFLTTVPPIGGYLTQQSPER